MTSAGPTGMLGHVISTLLMLLVVALAGWAVASLLRSPPSTRDPQPVSYTHLTLPTIYSV